MGNDNDDDIDDLIERLGTLDPAERRELSRRMQADWARRVGDAQRAYLERLQEENLVGGGGSVFQPIPGEEEEWLEYCREHPNDPICLAGAPPAVGDRLADFLDIRREYLSHLEEEGLADLEAASPTGGFRPAAGRSGDPSPQPSRGVGSPVGLTPPPGGWPPWPRGPWPPGPWPYESGGPSLPNLSMGGGGRRFDATRAAMGTFDPRIRATPGSGAATSPEGLTFPPDEWPPWPWPWPWPGPRPDPFPFGGDPVPFPASRW